MLVSGEIDRDALGDAVFSDPAARKRLNAATHLTVAMALVRSLLAAWLACKPIVVRSSCDGRAASGPKVSICELAHAVQVIDMALLFESGAYRLTRPRVLVACDEQNQQQRLMARNGLTAQQALARVSSQMPLEAKRRLADIIIDNNGSIDATQEQVLTSRLVPVCVRQTIHTIMIGVLMSCMPDRLQH